MVEENISQEFILRNIDETRKFFLEEIEQNESLGIKYKKVCTTLNYIEHFLILTPELLDIFQFQLKTVLRTYAISDLDGEGFFGTFYKKELQKTNQKEFRVEKVIKIKS